MKTSKPMGHGNHWECLGGTAEQRIQQFIPLVCAKGQVGSSTKRRGKWFDRAKPTEEAVIPLTYPTTPLRCLAILVSDTRKKTTNLYSAFPYAAEGGKRRLRIAEIRDWGNSVEGELLCETPADGILIGFFDTHYYVNQDNYEVGKEYDFRLAGLIYEARCTNNETIEVTDQAVLEERYAAWVQKPERLPDGTLPPEVFHLAGMTGLGPSDKYPDDAEFYCVIADVSEFEVEGIRIYQIVPLLEDDEDHKIPLPQVIFGAATVFKNDYVPRRGDSIGGTLWVQGFCDEKTA